MLQHVGHQLHAAPHIGIQIISLLNIDRLADVKDVAIRLAVVVADAEQRDQWRAGVASQSSRPARQARLPAKERDRNARAIR